MRLTLQMPGQDEITALLAAWNTGDQNALLRLCLVVYPELARIARRHLKGERLNHAIHPSSLVQEVFVRLLPKEKHSFASRSHFFALASEIMRHLLIDYARSQGRAKRGSLAEHLTIEAVTMASKEQLDQVIAIDLALSQLEQEDSRKAKVFELRFFGGFSVEEAAEALNVSSITVMRDWRFACAWLRRELAESSNDPGDSSPANSNTYFTKP
jgi:RNA polymerase sigma factor (TIGR02999 family)